MTGSAYWKRCLAFNWVADYLRKSYARRNQRGGYRNNKLTAKAPHSVTFTDLIKHLASTFSKLAANSNVTTGNNRAKYSGKE